MKNLTIYKTALTLGLATVLLTGCTVKNEETSFVKFAKKEDYDEENCQHLTIYFGDEQLTYKECDGYDVLVKTDWYYSRINYCIEKDDKRITSGETSQYNLCTVNHNTENNELDVESIQKTKK